MHKLSLSPPITKPSFLKLPLSAPFRDSRSTSAMSSSGKGPRHGLRLNGECHPLLKQLTPGRCKATPATCSGTVPGAVTPRFNVVCLRNISIDHDLASSRGHAPSGLGQVFASHGDIATVRQPALPGWSMPAVHAGAGGHEPRRPERKLPPPFQCVPAQTDVGAPHIFAASVLRQRLLASSTFFTLGTNTREGSTPVKRQST